MKKLPKDIVASVYARLTNEAKKLGRQYAEVLQYYGIERFLARLAQTNYADSFILKGGLVFYGWELPLRRPTKDIDFLGFVDNQKEIIHKVIADSLAISIPEDGVAFDIDSISIEETHVDSDHKGIRAKFFGYLVRLISEHFQLDDESLQKAIRKTFEVRNTSIPIGRPHSLSSEFANQYRTHWKTFLEKNSLENDHINDLPLLVEILWTFLKLPLRGLVSAKVDRQHRLWLPSKRKWK
ncbi:MAG TPA: nucleotidyl transferase AbiEii/AbiGii toxin family protein [Anaerolineales bacterium]|nr:nucleotidyl transferase AbiEii/AbiGii toxin family protein [Anaerolineales bacterium]